MVYLNTTTNPDSRHSDVADVNRLHVHGVQEVADVRLAVAICQRRPREVCHHHCAHLVCCAEAALMTATPRSDRSHLERAPLGTARGPMVIIFREMREHLTKVLWGWWVDCAA